MAAVEQTNKKETFVLHGKAGASKGAYQATNVAFFRRINALSAV